MCGGRVTNRANSAGMVRQVHEDNSTWGARLPVDEEPELPALLARQVSWGPKGANVRFVVSGHISDVQGYEEGSAWSRHLFRHMSSGGQSEGRPTQQSPEVSS